MLPAYRVNPMLVDLSPVNDALGSYQQQLNTNAKFGQDQKRLDMETERFQSQKQDAVRQRLGNVALLTLQENDPAKRAQKWAQIIQTHPDAASLDPKYHDPGVGPMAVLGDAKMAQDYLNYQMRMAQEGRAAAAAQREADLHPGQKKLQDIQIMNAQRDLDQGGKPQYKEINGALVEIRPGGGVREVYKGEPNFDKLPEFAAKSAGFATRMVDAERNVQELMTPKAAPNGGAPAPAFDPTTAKVGVLNATQNTPLETITNYALRSPEHQRYMQAAEQWIRAFLRKESGAAIGKDEFVRDFATYFPRPGDDPSVIAQKAAARQAAVRSFIGETRGFFEHTSPEQARYFYQLTKGKDAAPGSPSTGPVRVNSIEEAMRLKPGTQFITPDGRMKVR